MNRDSIIFEQRRYLTPKEKVRAEKIMELTWKINDYIDNKFKTEYTELYEHWHGNHCLQTAVMICGVLDEIKYLCPKIVYGIMEDRYEGQTVHYNHAYVYVQDTAYLPSAINYAIDMARTDRKQLFAVGDLSLKEKCEDSLDCPGYENIKILQEAHVNHKHCLMFEIEYFTQQPSFYLFREIRNKFINEINELNKEEQ